MDNKAAFYYSKAKIEVGTRLGPDEPAPRDCKFHMELLLREPKGGTTRLTVGVTVSGGYRFHLQKSRLEFTAK